VLLASERRLEFSPLFAGNVPGEKNTVGSNAAHCAAALRAMFSTAAAFLTRQSSAGWGDNGLGHHRLLSIPPAAVPPGRYRQAEFDGTVRDCPAHRPLLAPT
jgi:hypothetical protein